MVKVKDLKVGMNVVNIQVLNLKQLTVKVVNG